MTDNAVMLRPVSITGAMVTAMDATESVAAWNAGTTYNTGDEARSDTTNRVYRSAIDSNLNQDPTNAANVPSKWIDVRPTNPWAMFDALKSTRTTRADSLSWTLEPGSPVDCLGLARLSGTTVTIDVTDGVDSYGDFPREISLVSTEGIDDWFSWFFAERVQEDTIFLADLPVLSAPEISITVTGTDAGVGVCQIGRQLDIGSTAAGANLDFTSFSEYENDGFGGVGVTPRGYALWEEVQLFLGNDRVKYVRNQVLRYRDTPVFFALAGDFSILTVFGFARRFAIEIPYPNHSLVSLRVDETLEES